MQRLTRVDPNLVLAGAAGSTVLAEAAYRTWTSALWLLAAALVSGAALLLAWRSQERLRLGPVLAVVGGLALALVGVHWLLDVTGDKDTSVVYRWQGNGLLRGEYPRSEYPLGAVLLFGLEAWVGGGTTRWPNALLMAPFAVLVSACVWLTRLPYAPWLAAVAGLWPANTFFWQYKFDLVPAALLALGLLFALRARWALAGLALGAGTLVKWTPALALVALAAWLAAGRRLRELVALGGAFVAAIVLVHLPFLLRDADRVLAAYERQTGRSITPESVWYLLLRPFDLARVRTHLSFAAGAPAWADVAATVLQLAAVVALAALVPVAFLLTNRIFSPQFLVVAFAGWALAAALVARTRAEQLAVGVAMGVAALANEFVYPFALPWYAITWVAASAVLFATGLALTGWLAARAR